MPTPNAGRNRAYGFDYHTQFPGSKKEAWVYFYGPDYDRYVQGIHEAREDGFLTAEEKKLCLACVPEAMSRLKTDSNVRIYGLRLYRICWNWCDFS